MNIITFHRIDISQVDSLQLLGKKTFSEAFASSNTVKNMAYYLDTAFSTDVLANEINNVASQFYYVRQSEQTVGYFKVNFDNAQTETIDPNGMELHRIYILAEHQGKKIGEAIMGKVFEIAELNGVDFIWLGVWDKNPGAIKFYERHGFVIINSHSFMMGDEEQNDFIMKKMLR